MGGIWVTPNIEKLIIDSWLKLRKEGYEPIAKKVLTYANSCLLETEQKYIELPGIRKVQLILKKARENLLSLPEAEKILDEPWTMLSLAKGDIPSTAIPEVVDVWRYCISTDEFFSIRQAKWVSYLYHFITDTTLLWYWSRMYTDYELVSLASKESIDTRLEDSNLLFGFWERKTLGATDYYKGMEYFSRKRLLIHKANDGGIAEELMHGIEGIESMIFEDRINDRDDKLSSLIADLPSFDSLGLSLEAKLVYLRWFTYITKGSKWSELSAEEAFEIIKELRQWVLSNQEKILSIEKINTPELDKRGTFGDFLVSQSPIMPAKLLDRVGYKVYVEGE